MKKNLLCILALAASMSAFAQGNVIFEDDFEWLAPWAKAKEAGNTIGTNNSDAYCPQLTTPKVTIDEVEVSAYDALLAKGYTFTAWHASTKDERKPGAQSYLQENYLKFGLTGYQTALTLPKLDVPAEGANLTISFDWCSQRTGAGAWDGTKLVVAVNNGGEDVLFEVPAHNYVQDGEYSWTPVTLALGDIVTSASKVTIRNIDSQLATTKAYRFYLDNIKVVASATAGIADIEADGAPTEYFSILGVKVDNPTSGLYIRRQGNKVEKVLVK